MLALAEDDRAFEREHRVESRRRGDVKTPPVVGWRLARFGRPHLMRQLIKRSVPMRADEYLVKGPVEKFVENREKKEEEEKLRRAFVEHAAKWRKDLAFSSSLLDMVLHPSYLRIIGMGYAALPLILMELQKGPEQWFAALEAITGENPVLDNQRGRVREMAHAWIDWAKKRNILE